MWVLKIKGREQGNIYEEKTLKNKVKIYFYAHNHYEEGDKVFLTGSGIVEGKEENKKAFLKDLKKDKKVTYFESNVDYFVCAYAEDKKSRRGKGIKASYNPRYLFLKPAVVDENGWEHWEIASPDKKVLDEMISKSEKLKGLQYEILKFKQEKIENLMIYTSMPKLTTKQKDILMLAIKREYYGYPRKVNLAQLAKEKGISTSTLQFHLAKAEQKMLTYLAQKS